tara:strand:- start:1411 stop:1620 length:210 start_codon:yes stop_codon:yes gene_type:complete
MNLTINGEPTVITCEDKPVNMHTLITKLGYHPKLIVIEFNGTILESNYWQESYIKDGDSIEIVTIVGGG